MTDAENAPHPNGTPKAPVPTDMPAEPAMPAEPETAEMEAAEMPAEPEMPTEPAPSARAADAGPRGLELYLLRHADAGDPAMWEGDDSDRPLSKRGRKQSRKLGKLLEDLGWRPDLVLTSPKVRAAQTAKVVGKHVGASIRMDDRLGNGLDAASLDELMSGLDAAVASVVLVGHDPDFSSLASWLVGAPLSLRKGALARIDLPDRSVAAGRGSLRWLLPPDAVAG